MHAKEEDQMPRIIVSEYNREIDEVLAQVKAGNFISSEVLEKEMEHW